MKTKKYYYVQIPITHPSVPDYREASVVEVPYGSLDSGYMELVLHNALLISHGGVEYVRYHSDDAVEIQDIVDIYKEASTKDFKDRYELFSVDLKIASTEIVRRRDVRFDRLKEKEAATKIKRYFIIDLATSCDSSYRLREIYFGSLEFNALVCCLRHERKEYFGGAITPEFPGRAAVARFIEEKLICQKESVFPYIFVTDDLSEAKTVESLLKKHPADCVYPSLEVELETTPMPLDLRSVKNDPIAPIDQSYPRYYALDIGQAKHFSHTTRKIFTSRDPAVYILPLIEQGYTNDLHYKMLVYESSCPILPAFDEIFSYIKELKTFYYLEAQVLYYKGGRNMDLDRIRLAWKDDFVSLLEYQAILPLTSHQEPPVYILEVALAKWKTISLSENRAEIQ